MVSVTEESVMPDPVPGCPVRGASHDDDTDDSDTSMIDSDSDSSMDVSAPYLSMIFCYWQCSVRKPVRCRARVKEHFFKTAYTIQVNTTKKQLPSTSAGD